MNTETARNYVKIESLLPHLRELRDLLQPDIFSESTDVIDVKEPAYNKLDTLILALESALEGN